MLDFVKKAVMIGSGLAAMTAEKIEEVVQEIVKKGEISEKEGKELVAELVEKSKKIREEWTHKMEKGVRDILAKLNVPTRKEIDELKARIEQLEKAGQKKE